MRKIRRKVPLEEALKQDSPWLFIAGGFLLALFTGIEAFLGGGMIVALLIGLYRSGVRSAERRAEKYIDKFGDRFWSRRRFYYDE
ncbi:MAG: hypothetical protein JRI50_10685 [Deltaproteobacteria bacterium]|nr:hypothetical protein [Deltaproteobacteria bacterium]MBW1987666.1 hypothetical protein [Deltaproteobacteria bacterium]